MAALVATQAPAFYFWMTLGRCRTSRHAINAEASNESRGLAMPFTHWLSIIPAIQNGWSFAAFAILVALCLYTRK
jgi:hypothetical protein